MGTDSFIVYIKTDDIYIDIAEDVETTFYTSRNQLDLKEKTKKITGLIKQQLGVKIETRFVRLRAKTCSYLIDDGSKDKKAKGTKRCVKKNYLNLKMIKAVQKELKFIKK